MLKREGLWAVLVLTMCGLGYMVFGLAHADAVSGLTAQDYIDIEQNYARYYQTIDAGDLEGWADTFTEDGSFNGAVGRAALIAARRPFGHPKTRHFAVNLVITPTAEGAKGSVYVFVVDPQTVPLKIKSYSRYDDTLVKTSKGWRFKTRQRSSDTTFSWWPGKPGKRGSPQP